MGRIYTVTFPSAPPVTGTGGNADLFEFQPADDKPIRLRGFRLGQISEVGDSAEEGVEIQVIRLPATVTSANGTAVTPAPTDSADVAAGFSAEINGSTVATTTGTAVIMESCPWNIRSSPLEVWYPGPEFSPKAKQGEALVIRLITTVADDVTMGGTAWIEEE